MVVRMLIRADDKEFGTVRALGVCLLIGARKVEFEIRSLIRHHSWVVHKKALLWLKHNSDYYHALFPHR